MPSSTAGGMKTGIIATLGKFTVGAAKSSQEVETLSLKTGLSTQEVQGLQFAAGMQGTSFDDLVTDIMHMKEAMNQAQGGTGTTTATETAATSTASTIIESGAAISVTTGAE